MKTLALSAAKRPLSAYAGELGEEVLVLTEGNRPVAAIVPLRNVDRESLALSTHPGFLALIERSRREVATGRTRSLEEMSAAFATPEHGRNSTPATRGRGRTKRSTQPRPQSGSSKHLAPPSGRGG
jgi:antitoxin (DNA-binding transcriptional repressor) of toxin-antitoxin stability system